MRKLFVLSAMVIFLMAGCAATTSSLKAPDTFETGQSRSVMIETIVQVVTEEGYVIDDINEKYGLVSCKPMKILTGKLMKVLGEPGAGFVGSNKHLIHIVEFSAVVTLQGQVRLKVVASTVKDHNIFSTILQTPDRAKSMSIDTHRSAKLKRYLMDKIISYAKR